MVQQLFFILHSWAFSLFSFRHFKDTGSIVSGKFRKISGEEDFIIQNAAIQWILWPSFPYQKTFSVLILQENFSYAENFSQLYSSFNATGVKEMLKNKSYVVAGTVFPFNSECLDQARGCDVYSDLPTLHTLYSDNASMLLYSKFWSETKHGGAAVAMENIWPLNMLAKNMFETLKKCFLSLIEFHILSTFWRRYFGLVSFFSRSVSFKA